MAFNIALGVWSLISVIAVIWAIIDIVGQKKQSGWKVIWVLVSLILGAIGVAIYYFFSGRKANGATLKLKTKTKKKR